MRSWLDIGLYCSVQTCWIVILSMQYAWLRYYYFNYLHMNLLAMNGMIALSSAAVFAFTPFLAYYADAFIAAPRLVVGTAYRRMTNRRLLLTALTLLYCTTNYLLFAVPDSVRNTHLTAWVCTFYSANQVAYSIAALNWASFGMRMSRSRRERSKILLLSSTAQTLISVPFAIIIGQTDANGFRSINAGFTVGLATTLLAALWYIDIEDDADDGQLRTQLPEKQEASLHLLPFHPAVQLTRLTNEDADDVDDINANDAQFPVSRGGGGIRETTNTSKVSLVVACMFHDPPFRRIFLCTLFAYTYMLLPRDALILQAYFGLSQSDIGRNGAIIQSVAVITTLGFVQLANHPGVVRSGLTKERLYALMLGAWAFFVAIECLQITPGEANNNGAFWCLLLADAIFATPQVSMFQSVVSDAVVYNRIAWKCVPESNLMLIMVNSAGFLGQIGTSMVYVILDRVGLHDVGDLTDGRVASSAVTDAIRWILFASALPTLCLSLWPLLWPHAPDDPTERAQRARPSHAFFAWEPHSRAFQNAVWVALALGAGGFVYGAIQAGLDSLYLSASTMCAALFLLLLLMQTDRLRLVPFEQDASTPIS